MKTKETFTFSKEQLTNAFSKWNKDYLKKPDELEDITVETLASDQADLLIDYLKDSK